MAPALHAAAAAVDRNGAPVVVAHQARGAADRAVRDRCADHHRRAAHHAGRPAALPDAGHAAADHARAAVHGGRVRRRARPHPRSSSNRSSAQVRSPTRASISGRAGQLGSSAQTFILSYAKPCRCKPPRRFSPRLCASGKKLTTFLIHLLANPAATALTLPRNRTRFRRL